MDGLSGFLYSGSMEGEKFVVKQRKAIATTVKEDLEAVLPYCGALLVGLVGLDRLPSISDEDIN